MDRDVAQPAGNLPHVLSLVVFYASTIKESRLENTIFFQIFVS